MPAAAATFDFARMSVQDLAAVKGEWVILDARPRSAWQQSHIPTALSFSWEDYTRTDSQGVPYRTWPQQELANALGTMGIDADTPLVIYGDADTTWGGEGWAAWVFAWLGHRGPVRLVDGGMQAWQASGLPTDAKTATSVAGKTYVAAVQENLTISTAHLAANLDDYALVDTRALHEWLRVRIDGAERISWKDMFSGDWRRPLGSAAYRQLLAEHGIDLQKPVVYFCTGGIRSGYAWMVHQLSGLPAAINYEGGIEAWSKLSGDQLNRGRKGK